ncbi:MAG: DUF975 family protein [Candidatus Cloacimonetes bacterium]|nr:DUF975 family protein [Candidatus Cloacimonadota bacterium]
MLESFEIRAEARRLLTGQWNNCAIIMFVYFLLQSGISAIPRVGWIGSLAIAGPLALGLATTYLNLVKGYKFGIDTLFRGSEDFMRSFVAGILVYVYTILWTLLFIVPGIIASLSYSMTFFILHDNPQISAQDAIKRSKEMMVGHKTELFMLMLSFFGWFILGIIGFGIPFFWIGAYFYTSATLFYQNLSGAANEEVIAYMNNANETI